MKNNEKTKNEKGKICRIKHDSLNITCQKCKTR